MPGDRVFLGNIPHRTRERDIERFFKNYGRLRDIVIKQGYGFVEFDDRRDAEDAVHDMDGKELLGERLRVEMARSRERDRGGRDRGRFGGGRFGGGGGGGRRGNAPGPRTNYRLIVENVSSKTSWQDLKDFFRSSGEITYANVHSSRQGEGIVEFASRRGLDYALDHRKDHELHGRRLKVREESRGGRGRRDSRSRSRSRSRSSRSRSSSESQESRSRSGSRSRRRD